MDAKTWLDLYAERLGVEPPDPASFDALLDLAGVAAHNSERLAAPLTCWLVGVAGITPDEALTIGREIAAQHATDG